MAFHLLWIHGMWYNFKGKAKIQLDSFLLAFNIAGLADEFYHNDSSPDKQDGPGVEQSFYDEQLRLVSWKLTHFEHV